MSVDQDVIVARRMLRDIVECSEYDSISRALGFVPAGPEVEDSEHMASHERLEATAPLVDQIFDAADIAGEVLLRLGTLSWPLPPSEEDREQTQRLCRTTCMAVITHLVDMRFLEVA